MQKHCSLQIVNIPCWVLGLENSWRRGEMQRSKLQTSEPAQPYGSFPYFCAAGTAAATTAALPQSITPAWDLHLLVAICSQVFLPWKAVTVQSDRVKCCAKAVHSTLTHLFSLLAILGFLSLGLPTLGTQKPACPGHLMLFLHVWSFGLIRQGERIY